MVAAVMVVLLLVVLAGAMWFFGGRGSCRHPTDIDMSHPTSSDRRGRDRAHRQR